MKTPTPSERRALRARAHALDPVVIIGQHGLTPAVLKEIDSSLTAHELIKVRCAEGDRAARETTLARICGELDAAPVQHLGKLLVIWRPRPEDTASARPAVSNKPSTTTAGRRRAGTKARGAAPKASAATPRGRGARDLTPTPGARGTAGKRPRQGAGTAKATTASAGRAGDRAGATGASRRRATATQAGGGSAEAGMKNARGAGTKATPPAGATSRRRRRTT